MAKLNVRARAVDLLGRQQVAGIPTAISELFKNAHDAYAKRVEVDYYRRRNLLVLRDDGVGMSKEDFEGRWLTIGTESKADNSQMAKPPVDLDQPLRPVMGEKGIGRLAIALIGTQVLIMTRPKYGSGSGSVTAAFINWNVFSLPGVDLGSIEIPVREFDFDALPNAQDVAEMVATVRENVQKIAPSDLANTIFEELDSFKIDPADISNRLPDGPNLKEQSGTQFWILPTNEILGDDIDGFGGRYKATPLEKVLLGFSNTMTPNHPAPPIETRFRDHLTNGTFEERIAEGTFFTPEEFRAADHHVHGTFDARGQFTGTVQVYGGQPTAYQVRWPGAEGRDTLCGPVIINFSYLQGNYRDSGVPKDEHDRLSEKLNRIGGLYIYRDGIRILPYGDADYDFLDIEGRRTRSASYYFFSYRRMFGVIEITRKENYRLLEKAGREGFQENKAYRQFRDMLENFFVQTAADFFRDDGAMAETWSAERTRINKEKELIAKRNKQVTARRAQLSADLGNFFSRVNEEYFESECQKIVEQLKRRLGTADPGDLSAAQLGDLEASARAALAELTAAATVKRPSGVGLTRELSRSWARYEIELPRLQEHHFRPTFQMVDELVAETADRLDLDLSPRQRVTALIEDLGGRERKRAKTLQSDVQRNLEALRGRALDHARSGFQAVEESVRSTLIELERANIDGASDQEIQATREKLETSILVVADKQAALLERLRDQLKQAATPEALEQDDIIQALEGELEERRESDFESLQLAQMGAAIGIVHHEFHAVIRTVRQNIRQLKSWANRNPQLETIYRDINDSYSHLDGYLSLFAPLNKRLYRRKRVISGEDIFKYLDQLLGSRLNENHISFKASDQFINSKVKDFVSNLYPAFVNLVDNAVFWLSSSTAYSDSYDEGARFPQRQIYLDYDNFAYVIRDNGPGILSLDQDAVFQAGFSRKPQGSGLGLYITKSLLDRAGYNLTLDPFVSGRGATFRISIPQEARDGEDLYSDEGDEG